MTAFIGSGADSPRLICSVHGVCGSLLWTVELARCCRPEEIFWPNPRIEVSGGRITWVPRHQRAGMLVAWIFGLSIKRGWSVGQIALIEAHVYAKCHPNPQEMQS